MYIIHVGLQGIADYCQQLRISSLPRPAIPTRSAKLYEADRLACNKLACQLALFFTISRLFLPQFAPILHISSTDNIICRL